MKKVLISLMLVVGLVVGLVSPVFSATVGETITVSTVPVGFTSTLLTFPDGTQARTAFCTVPANDLRFWVHGIAPTSTVGHLVKGGDNISIILKNNIRSFRAIKDTGSAGDVTMTCTYEN